MKPENTSNGQAGAGTNGYAKKPYGQNDFFDFACKVRDSLKSFSSSYVRSTLNVVG